MNPRIRNELEELSRNLRKVSPKAQRILYQWAFGIPFPGDAPPENRWGKTIIPKANAKLNSDDPIIEVFRTFKTIGDFQNWVKNELLKGENLK